MSIENTGRNGDGVMPTPPDANGQAAILLVESLMHGLIAQRVITVADALEIVDIAAEAEADVWSEPPDETADPGGPGAILAGISRSLRLDASGV
ncbi:hypothetical protein [Brevundimonas lutea]|uniref:hypothetical protein n=1 Tax=Brevundimonas lutea TaxID=2293980 RepID=UPI0013CE598E|nr:hypothetical protein [Brevundimonas lutea]